MRKLGVSRPAFWKKDGYRTCLNCNVATMAQQSKLSNYGSHATSKMRDATPLEKMTCSIRITFQS
jgi:hypothetical protein